jgi:hypothetical protein
MAAVYVRYSFTKQLGAVSYPPTTVTSPYLPVTN